MARFQVPNASDMQDMFTIFRFINNTTSNGIFFPIMLLVTWIIAFVGSIASGREASRGFIFASFLSTIIAILLVTLGFLNKGYMYLLILFMAFGILWIKLTGRRANL